MRSRNVSHERLAVRRLVRFASVAALITFVVYHGAYLWQLWPVPGSLERSFAHGGRERTYIVRPGSAEPKGALVFVLHGSGGQGRMIERRAHFDAIAERAGVVVAYPDGVDRVWNDGWSPHAGADDVGFLSALSDALVAEFRIDPSHVYAAGFSNGAGMVHRLACEADRFTAIAAIGGYMAPDVALRCRDGKPVSVLAIHGTDDRSVPYGPELARSVEHWVARDGCTEPVRHVRLPDTDTDDGTQVRLDEHTRCRGGARVALYTIEGGGHTWPGEEPDWRHRSGAVCRDIDPSPLLLEFFRRSAQPLE
jgi:polyhydroxybutyrate depolymerase